MGHFHRGRQRGALGFFNKPLMCFVMHWLYFTVKAILLLCQPVHFSPNCLFLQLPLVMLSSRLHRYHLFIFYENNNPPTHPNQTQLTHPTPNHPPMDGSYCLCIVRGKKLTRNLQRWRRLSRECDGGRVEKEEVHS